MQLFIFYVCVCMSKILYVCHLCVCVSMQHQNALLYIVWISTGWSFHSCVALRCLQDRGMIELHHPSHCDPLSLSAPFGPLSVPPLSTCSPCTWTGTLRLTSTVSLSTWRIGNLCELIGENEQSCSTTGSAEPWVLWFRAADKTRIKPVSLIFQQSCFTVSSQRMIRVTVSIHDWRKTGWRLKKNHLLFMLLYQYILFICFSLPINRPSKFK